MGSHAHHVTLKCLPRIRDAVRRRSATIIKSSQSIEETDPLRVLITDFKPLEKDQVGNNYYYMYMYTDPH